MHVAQGYTDRQEREEQSRTTSGKHLDRSRIQKTLTRSSLSHLQSRDAQRPEVTLQAKEGPEDSTLSSEEFQSAHVSSEEVHAATWSTVHACSLANQLQEVLSMKIKVSRQRIEKDQKPSWISAGSTKNLRIYAERHTA